MKQDIKPLIAASVIALLSLGTAALMRDAIT